VVAVWSRHVRGFRGDVRPQGSILVTMSLTIGMFHAELDLSSTLLSPSFFGVVIRELGVRDRVPVVHETQVVYVQTGKSGPRIGSRVWRWRRAKAAL